MRQGKGWFHIPCGGHEGVGAIASSLREDDLVFPYYRDRALMLARGVSPLEIARDQLATARSSCAGRVMPLHGSYRRLGIFPPIGPTAGQCLPAVGAAWGVKLSGAPRVVLCTVGDAATRQGEFYEAVTFAVQEKLPLVFVVEDNAFGISTPTHRHLPFRLGIFASDLYRRVDGRSVDSVCLASKEAIDAARRGDGPAILWLELDRLGPHTHSDDHRTYRSAEELAELSRRDPIDLYTNTLLGAGELSETELHALRADAEAAVDAAYAVAEDDPSPDAALAQTELFGPSIAASFDLPFEIGQSGQTMVGALNAGLDAALRQVPNVIVFGEDVEDPKGGVFGFTKGLSTRYPGRVVNSPLAEATLIGAAVGLAATGYRPIVELQFIDFAVLGFNQLLNQAATLRWRSNGDWRCPLVLYAPCGAYLPAGGPWHSQSNEGFWTHIPGLRVAVPSTPQDLAGLLWTSLHEEDPTLILIPKHIMRLRHEPCASKPLGFGRARIVQRGADVTVVAWGNCVELARQACHELRDVCSAEIIDLITLVPCDWATIEASVAKTGRLVVINEDARTCSFGQAIICEMVASQDRFNRLLSPPLLVARDDTHVAFHPMLEYAVLPDVNRVRAALLEVLR